MPPTRREQFELDELLSDIYKGIETLPDKSALQAGTYSHHRNQFVLSPTSNKSSKNLYSTSYVREYELPASSPLVKQHKQELAALTAKQPQRSTLKRQTNTPDQSGTRQQSQHQSLASFVTSTTPENKRRVRIVDHPDKLNKCYSEQQFELVEPTSGEHFTESRAGGREKPANVKHVNTNKLIYHQERASDDEILSEQNSDENNSQENGDDIDGVTRVEYYHTTWLDKQLGRASKRRSSKELNERQVKEKAMIEELKRSLKNGAITLRQSFKGKKNSKNKPSETYDDQMLSSGHRNHESNVIVSGLATTPRKHHSNANGLSKSNSNQQRKDQQRASNQHSATTPKQTLTSDSSIDRLTGIRVQPAPDRRPQEQPTRNYSRTLPHNYQSTKTPGHQLLQSHYRANRSFNTLDSQRSALNTKESDTMRNVHFDNSVNNCHTGTGKSPTINNHNQSSQHLQQQQQQIHQFDQAANTISSIPSATEVVRSALSRSGSQVSLNQLNKTINLLPSSPSPYMPTPTPTTPTQQLKAASPSLSPSPIGSPYQPRHQSATQLNGACQTMPNTRNTSNSSFSATNNRPQQPTLHGTRTIERNSQPESQPVYANPHASLMQHRIEQQMRQPGRSNHASIREFNELDSLLRSLSPSSTHITPGFSTKPAQPSFGFGLTPAQPATAGQQARQNNNNSDIYAKVHKQQPIATNNPDLVAERNKSNYLQQHYGSNINSNIETHQPFTIDVTNKRDENCIDRQELSEFERPIELLPSMEDYQNITKLNPVKNHYWYKPNMSRDMAISLLKDKPQGTFIVRDSTSFRGAYGLAVKVARLPKNVLNNANLRNPNVDPSSELIRHFLIEPTSNGVRLKGYANEPVFSSLPSLIYQHSLTELALPCKLVIPRADIEDPNFNYKQKQFFDEFVASKEQAKHTPYERTSPNGGYRKYPGDVYVHNEHRIIFE